MKSSKLKHWEIRFMENTLIKSSNYTQKARHAAVS